MRKWIITAVFCWLVVFSVEKVEAVNEIVGLVLNFPSGSLDSVTKIELNIDREPDLVPIKDVRYTNMSCNKNDPNDMCPGYKDVGNGNYIQYYYPSYAGPALPGGLGTDWQRTAWTQAFKKITYTGGIDTLQSGIIDGYYYKTHPTVTDVVLTGYPGKTRVTFFYTGEYIDQWILLSYVRFYIWEILVEDDWALGDAIMALQIVVGIEPPATEYGPFDINTDGKIGMAEAIYILQKISGKR